jgi:hypothetical protein
MSGISGIAGGLPPIGPSASLMGQGTSTASVSSATAPPSSTGVTFDNILKDLVNNPGEMSKLGKELLEALLLHLLEKQNTQADPLTSIATMALAGVIQQSLSPQAAVSFYSSTAAVRTAPTASINVTA